MSNVRLTIAGRRYTLGCAEGEESHIKALGDAIDSKLSATPGMAGLSETHTLLYAALLMADEVHEASGGAKAASTGAKAAPTVAEPLEKMAERLEGLASTLEAAAASS